MQTIDFLLWPMSNICKIDSGFRFCAQNYQFPSLTPPSNALKFTQRVLFTNLRSAKMVKLSAIAMMIMIRITNVTNELCHLHNFFVDQKK